MTHGGRTRAGDRVRAWFAAFADEQSWGRRRARRAVIAERYRLAVDLHADVVPGLRQALADAERGAAPAAIASSLREVLADLEAVSGGRHPIQLDIGGLVPALAWLAERDERRSDLTITIDVADPAAGVAAVEPPRDVAAAAFMITALATANAAWHAPGSHVTISVAAGAGAVDLVISDDGPGIAPDAIATARANGRRGIADMVAEAAACGATLDIGPGRDGIGTAVTFAWRAPSEEATR